jgi:hypothetical protein
LNDLNKKNTAENLSDCFSGEELDIGHDEEGTEANLKND